MSALSRHDFLWAGAKTNCRTRPPLEHFSIHPVNKKYKKYFQSEKIMIHLRSTCITRVPASLFSNFEETLNKITKMLFFFIKISTLRNFPTLVNIWCWSCMETDFIWFLRKRKTPRTTSKREYSTFLNAD